MSIYNIDEFVLGISLMPPDKRAAIHREWIRELLSAMTRSDDILADYIDGFTGASAYNGSVTYSIGDLVTSSLNLDQVIYESQADGNMGNDLSDTDFWVSVAPNFIGAVERSKYYCSKMVFEYALNRWFNTTFREPTTIATAGYTPLSDIYITTNETALGLFYVGPTEFGSTYVGPTISTGWVSPDDTPSFYTDYQYTIWIPVAVYNALPGYNGSAGSADNTVRQFADKYNCAELKYIINTY